MIRDWLVWLQTQLGKGSAEGAQSWSEQLLGSLNFWNILEGTHLLSLMLFAGCIFVVDLRLLGVIFRRTPVSVIDRKVLPLAIWGMVFMTVTGLWLFFAKPLVYYHNLWFRLKVLLILAALVNIAVFHFRVQKSQGAWDALPKPPLGARVSALVSIVSWVAVITCGRFIAYNWFDCGKPHSGFINAVQECAKSEHGAKPLAPGPVALGGPRR